MSLVVVGFGGYVSNKIEFQQKKKWTKKIVCINLPLQIALSVIFVNVCICVCVCVGSKEFAKSCIQTANFARFSFNIKLQG